ncbi:MAG: hypothetical protein KatS3mg105_1766 [Gemmatales bacterium]|nr:MAG: hypothetical protein KatS3mg105_1766 [Gemmatales bacterium]
MAENAPGTTPGQTTEPLEKSNANAQATGNSTQAAPAESAPEVCSQCGATRVGNSEYCGDCGWVFGADAAAVDGEATAELPANPVRGRFKVVGVLVERGEVTHYDALDMGENGDGAGTPVVLIRGPISSQPENTVAEEVAEPVAEDEPLEAEILPDFADAQAGAEEMPPWPSIEWENTVLNKARHPALPVVLDRFIEGEHEYLVVEVPQGTSLWDAWDDMEVNNYKRFGWLVQVAQGMQQLHKAGAILESIRPDYVVISPEGQARIKDLTELLPLPLPPDPLLRAGMYTAPELILTPDKADARANLYSFGAMVFSLFNGRELTDMDFDPSQQYTPKPFMARFPDAHPAFARLITKTFVRDLGYRFPTDEAAKTDPTGFTELIKTLETCQRTLDNVRLEIAAWTTTGMVRTNNEDAFALMHAIESYQDEMTESALVILCDGMGGYEAGEIASNLAIKTLRKILLSAPMFAALSGDSPQEQEPFDVEKCKQLLRDALKETNKQVFEAPNKGIGKRGMGCTADVVYINGQNVVVGHVGDSRTYHLHQGQIIQMTRDQTLVNRLVELGQITPEEAENHPRRSELQQAIGGRATVDPALYHGKLKAGDWILVCSDGLTNHIKNEELRQMMLIEAGSAEIAARRLVNFVNLRGATDNSTLVVVRAT